MIDTFSFFFLFMSHIFLKFVDRKCFSEKKKIAHLSKVKSLFPIPQLSTLKNLRWNICVYQRRIQDFKLGGTHLKKLHRAEGGAKIFGVFRVKNHDFTPKNHIFSNCGGRRENFWGISCEKSRFYAKKSYFFQF